MAIKYLNDNMYLLTKSTTANIVVILGTDEDVAVLASVNGGNFAAVNAGTTETKITGGDSGVIYKLTINAADTATVGPLVLELKGATDTTYVWCQVVEELPGCLKADAISAATIADDAIEAGMLATGALTSDAFAAGALAEGVFGAGAINAAAIKDAAIDAATFAAGAINAAAIATDAIGAAELAADAVVEIAAGVTTIATAGTLRHVYHIQHNEATAAKRTFMVDVPTADTQTVTISRNGGAYAPCASGTACTQVTGTEYKLVLALADCSTVGTMRVKCTGSGAGVQITDFVVCEYDPYTAGASTMQEMKYRAS